MSSLVTGVDFVMLPTRDLAAASEFYGGVLGLECSARYGGERGAEFETGSLTLQLLAVDKLGLDFNATPNPVALHVDDVAAARTELEAAGVEFAADTMDSGVCHMAFFRDPDGNALMLHHRYAPMST
jgi:catechol 2,3-dioxygenase-like lactoylglutathione lyase family enzyme